MSIRPATPADIPRLMEIREAVRENRLSDPKVVPASDYCEFIAHSGIWVWEEFGQILGFSAGDTRSGWVWALFVDPPYERRGIGRALLPEACASLRRAGHQILKLSTAPGTRAERFYLADGWRPAGRSASGEIVFEKVG
ncbi:GNAT family N-acetyltransferase [Polyangium aurulentum]|uniref:GNAT family N-acetyltransferase n=1 Tax=Polyangium aurulentum TaxID=2567896 RepID=UPI00197F150C|nr:GNAT family N-acetyltransferase [Polyangium aurulentum]UQA56274.1 GNAT family N-acetyltransferase [Polyangium aurulentum]